MQDFGIDFQSEVRASGNTGSPDFVFVSSGPGLPPRWISVQSLIAQHIAPLQQQINDLNIRLTACCGGGISGAPNTCNVVASFANNIVTVVSGCANPVNKCKITIFCGTNNITGFDLNCGQTKTFTLTAKCLPGASLIVIVDSVVIFVKTLP